MLHASSPSVVCRISHTACTWTTCNVVQVLFMSDQQLQGMQQFAASDPHPGSDWRGFSSSKRTAAKRFRAACNCAAASPDGRWIAVVGDMPHLVLMQATTSRSQASSLPQSDSNQETGQTVCRTVARLEFNMEEPYKTPVPSFFFPGQLFRTAPQVRAGLLVALHFKTCGPSRPE